MCNDSQLVMFCEFNFLMNPVRKREREREREGGRERERDGEEEGGREGGREGERERERCYIFLLYNPVIFSLL